MLSWRAIQYRCTRGGPLAVLLEVDRGEGCMHCRTAHCVVQHIAQRNNSSLRRPAEYEHEMQEGATGEAGKAGP
jgi:hypothetical protein